METTSDMKALFIIVNAGFSEEVIELTRTAGVTGATIFNARGEGAHHEMFMGITVDTEKELILSIADKKSASHAMETIQEKAGVKTPAHAICFMLPVEKVTGLRLPVLPADR